MRGIRWLDNPNVLLRVVLLELLVMLVEFTKFIWQDVGVRNEVEMLLSEALLHPHDIEAKPVLSRDFVALRKMVNLLILVQALIEVTLAA